MRSADSSSERTKTRPTPTTCRRHRFVSADIGVSWQLRSDMRAAIGNACGARFRERVRAHGCAKTQRRSPRRGSSACGVLYDKLKTVRQCQCVSVSGCRCVGGMLVRKCVGAVVCWCVGVLVCWCVGALVCWCVGVLVHRCVSALGVSVCLCVGVSVSVCRCVRVSVRRCVGASVSWCVGVWMRW